MAPLANLDNRYLAVAYTREVVAINGYRLAPNFRLADLGGIDLRDPSLPGRRQIEDRLASSILDARTGEPPADLHERGMGVLSEPMRVFIGCAVSHLPFDSLERLEILAAEIEKRLLELGLRSFTAVRQANPNHQEDPFDPYDPAVGLLDSNEAARADVLVAIHDRPSTGLGVNVAQGQNAGAFTVFAEVTSMRSPLTSSLGYEYEVIELDPIDGIPTLEVEGFARRVAGKVTSTVTDRIPALEQHRRIRLRRPARYGAEHLAVAEALGCLDEASLARLPLPAARVEQLHNSLDLYSIASREEQDLLLDALGAGRAISQPTRAGLNGDEYRAALQAARENRWSDERLSAILEAASDLVLSGEHRTNFADPPAFTRLARTLGD